MDVNQVYLSTNTLNFEYPSDMLNRYIILHIPDVIWVNNKYDHRSQ